MPPQVTMTRIIPIISVIIPTHNRSGSLKRTLDSLSVQNYSLQQMEVIVVADGCSDGTIEMLRSYSAPFVLKYIEQSGQGAAVARNQGVAQARGSILIFIDDDIEVAPQFVEAHFRTHQGKPELVTIGYLPPVRSRKASFFHTKLWLWWESTFQAMRQPGYRFSYRNLFSGNFSISRELFNRVGGFDPAFRGHEDCELGARLIQAGADFTFALNAWGYHHDISDFNRILRRKYLEGQLDVQLGRKHPDLISTLPISFLFESCNSFFFKVLLTSIFQWPSAGDLVFAFLRRCLNVLEWLRMRGYWQMLQKWVFGYWYLRGVADAVKKPSALMSFLQSMSIKDKQSEIEIELDLQKGLATAEQELNISRPTSVRLYYGQQPVGYIPCTAGCERLRGAHLKPILATSLAYPFLQALALEGVNDTPLLEKTLSTQFSISSLEKVYAD